MLLNPKMRSTMIARCSAILATIGLLICQLPTCMAQDFYEAEAHRVAEAIATETGLTLPPESKDLFSFIETQEKRANCETIEVKWTILPGQKGPLPAKEAEALNLPQTFTYQGRPEDPGYKPTCRVLIPDFAFFGVIIFGVTHSGQIRGIQVSSDLRQMIVECPELFGKKSTPETKCGYFTLPETSVRVVMPRESGIEELVFFTRIYTDREHWHLVRAGSLGLPASPTKKPT